MFGAGAAGGLGALGLNADEVMGAMKMEFKDIQTTEKSRTGDNAVVTRQADHDDHAWTRSKMR